jgi:hypothetical protein
LPRILPEWLQEIGAAAGLATAAFTIFDRWARGRPRISIFVSEDDRSVRVSNDAPYVIAILKWSVIPKVYAVAEAATLNAATRAAAGDSFQTMMESKTECAFPLTLNRRAGEPLDRVHKWALIALHWRKGASLWIPQIPVLTIVPTAVLRSIRTRGYRLGELEPRDNTGHLPPDQLPR